MVRVLKKSPHMATLRIAILFERSLGPIAQEKALKHQSQHINGQNTEQ
jgi:hypothetical protein